MIRYCTVCRCPLIADARDYNLSPIPMYCIDCYKKMEDAYNQADIFDGEDDR